MADGDGESNELLYSTEGAVARVTFNRPQARNALTFAMYEGLREICAAVPTDGSVRALVIEGAGGKAFAAGTDMKQFRTFEGPQDALAYEAMVESVISTVEACPVPTIAALTGACTGGGAAIAAAADLRVAAPSLRFGFPIARTLGNCLAVAHLRRLAAMVGVARVREMILTARLLDAEQAMAVGLVTEIADDASARAMELAAEIAGFAPLTLRATKRGLNRMANAVSPVADDDLIALCYTSADFQEGIEAFLAKRKPVWKGK